MLFSESRPERCAQQHAKGQEKTAVRVFALLFFRALLEQGRRIGMDF